MDDAYQEVGYTEPEPKKRMSGWLIVLIVVAVLVVVCCLCILLSLLLLGPEVGTVFSTVIETMEAMTPVP